ncbi:ATP-binding protein [Streptomyces sp. MAR4 CNX-425]|uniref:ATP-binding protein n=1 Tax=Streptomyces sp. MAR4 CNX-425 TaxID=3406343 RepID=UPI003B50ED5A
MTRQRDAAIAGAVAGARTGHGLLAVRAAAPSGLRRASVVLPGASTATPRCAREIIRAWLAAWQVPAGRTYDTLVVVGELTTNALLHTDSSQIVVGVQLTGRELRRLTVQVVDQGPSPAGWADRRDAPGGDGSGGDGSGGDGSGDDEAVSGRGLAVVAALADRWGAARRLAGTSVWAQLAVPAIRSRRGEGPW